MMNFEELKTKFTVNRQVRADEYEDKKNYLIHIDIDPVADTRSPKLIFAAGQPGSGKTYMINKIKEDYIKEDYPAEDFVVIDIDNYRKIHPDFDEIRHYPNDACYGGCGPVRGERQNERICEPGRNGKRDRCPLWSDYRRGHGDPFS